MIVQFGKKKEDSKGTEQNNYLQIDYINNLFQKKHIDEKTLAVWLQDIVNEFKGDEGAIFIKTGDNLLCRISVGTTAQAKEMSDAGMAIEGHGRDHLEMRGRSNDFLVYQILGIQEAIHYHTGRLPRFFAYPSGQYDANTVAVLKSADYWGAVTTEWGREHTLDNRFEMLRLRIRGRDTLGSFIDKLED